MKNELDLERSYTIKDLPVSERPREKLISYGVEALSNAELIALVITTGSLKDTAVELGQKVISMDSRGLAHLSEVSLEDLMKINGIGEAKATQILATIEIGKRISRFNTHDKIKVSSPHILANLLMDEMRYLNKEHFRIAILDTKNQILAIENISIGTLNASIVHPRDVFYASIRRSANSIILIHNHPSGDPEPSNEDINITNRLIEAGNLLGIKVLDHIIIGDRKYISFKEKNLI